ncbi:MAG: phenylalanine--tRNA ligase subunit beta [Patescibacteria group bacterium]
MNIIIPKTWLLDFLDTEASTKEISKYLSLCGFSVEDTKETGKDTLFEIEITPNRPDALSVLGIARELGTILPRFGLKTKFEDTVAPLKLEPETKTLPLKINIEKPELAPRFTALVLDNINVKPSTQKVQNRLSAVGIRPLNNAIDVTNYLMIERGQPMHIFDYDKIKGTEMNLRESREGESIVTLDGVERNLPSGTIVIQDRERLIDLCGIRGGKNSGVSKQTERVVLFVQIYNPLKIRTITKKISFRTEAATRFEKGMDPQGVIPALTQAVHYLKQEANAKIASQLIDIENKKYKPHQVTVTKNQIQKYLGTELQTNKCTKILENLGFEFNIEDNTITATVPSWRAEDIEIYPDLIEEIARIYGYQNLPVNLPPLPEKLHYEEPTFKQEKQIRTAMQGGGFLETYHYTLTSKETLVKSEMELNKSILELKNPLTDDLTHLRPSLLPQMLETVAQNQFSREKLKLFKINRVFNTHPKKTLPTETQMLSAVIYTQEEKGNTHFFRLKGILQRIAKELNTKLRFSPVKKTYLWQAQKTAEIFAGEDKLGKVGQIKSMVTENFEIKGEIYATEINLEKLLKHANPRITYHPEPEFPPIIEDLTFLVSDRTLIGETINKLEERYKEKHTKLTIKVKDIYQDKKLKEAEQKAVTFNIRYYSEEKNLRDEDIQPIRKEIISWMKEAVNAKLRGKI